MFKLNKSILGALYFLIILSFALPYARFTLLGAPIYLTMVASLILFLNSSILTISKKVFYKDNGLFLLIGYFILITAFHLVYLETPFIIYNNFNRIVSLLLFFSVGILIYNNFLKIDLLLRIIKLGLKIHIILILVHFVCSILGDTYLESFYTIVYKVISNSEKFYSNIEKFQTDWYLMRYYGGYHNPNPSGVVLVLGYIILNLSKIKLNLVWFFLLCVSIVLTASKQSFAAFILFMVIRNIKYFPAYMLFSFILFEVFLVFNLYDYLNRLLQVDNYSVSADERSWGYLNFANFVTSNFLPTIFGTGINSLGLREVANLNIDSSKVGFVSNSVLLVISTIGLFGMFLLARFFYLIRYSSKNKKELTVFFIMIFFIALFDNHIAIMESLQIIIILGTLVIANITKNDGKNYIH